MQSGQLNFQQQRYDDPTQSLQNAFGAGSLFAKTLDRMESQQSENEKIRMLRDKEAWDRQQETQKMNMAIDTATREKSKFDTEQNTLRATAAGTTLLDKAYTGNALLDRQAATIGGLNNQGEFANPLLRESQAIASKYGAGAPMSKADEARFNQIQNVLGGKVQDILGSNVKNLNIQKQLIGEVGSQYIPEGQTVPVLYDPTSINRYKQDLIGNLDTRLDREASRAQAAAQFDASHRLALANSAKQSAHMRKMEQAQQEELDRGAAWQKSLIAPEKQVHKLYESKFGTEVIAPANKAKSEYIQDVRSKLNKLPGMSILRQEGMRIVVDDKTGDVRVLPVHGKKVDPSELSDMQKSISDKMSSLTEKTRSKFESYTPALNNPEAFGYKLSPKKYYDSSMSGAMKISGESYAPQRANFIEDPRAYAKEMQRQLSTGIDAYGNPLDPADILIRRELLASEQMKNAQIGAGSSKEQHKLFSK